MSGAYAHIAAVQTLTSGNNLDEITMPKLLKKALSTNPSFCIMGAVSPDYPYLDLTNPSSSKWADEMHNGGMQNIIKSGIKLIKCLENNEELEKCLAWFFGFLAHVGVDMTIHPIVEGIAGIYSLSKENQRKHRICEMNQDVHIWQKLNLGTIGRCEIIDNIRYCDDDKKNLYEPVRLFWDSILSSAYPELYSTNKPDINKWHKSFSYIVDIVEESHEWPRFARHVSVDAGLSYPLPSEVDDQYIQKLKTPDGKMLSYDEIFKKALSNVNGIWVNIAEAIENEKSSYISSLLSWNLDRGLTSSGGYLFW
ncbi:MAG: zinc dependent phospholipase C family protein [Alphaproteobacteria bacterium]